MRRLTLIALLSLLSVGCGSSRTVRIDVTPTRSTEAQPIAIRVEGLRPHERISLGIRSKDADGRLFSAHALFTAGTDGVVDTTSAKALAGSSYSGIWPMGLLTSMSATKPFALYEWNYRWNGAPLTFRLTATAGSRTIATAAFTRSFVMHSRLRIVEATVAKDGFLGTLYAPPGAIHRPAVLAFGGSEGGAGSMWEGEQLAADGIPNLEVGYFDAPTLPGRLVNIPLEYFRAALRWLERRPEVDPKRTSVMSGSYGTEAALLLAVHYPRLVHRVVALTPSNVVTCGIVGGTNRRPGCLGSPWTFEGKPLPYTKIFDNARPWDDPRAVIPVERIEVPVFVSCGGYDTDWSSCAYARAIVTQRRGETTVFRSYANAGHASNGAFFEYEPGSLAHDIYVPADERAREDLTPRVLRFLRFAS